MKHNNLNTKQHANAIKIFASSLWKGIKFIFKYSYKIIKSLFFFMFPFVSAIYANSIINNKLKKEDFLPQLDKNCDLANIEIADLKKHYDKTFESKNSLESKAQNGIFSLTIVITLIFSIIGLKKDLFTTLPNNIKYLIMALAITTLIYFLIGGFINLHLLIGKNEMSFITWQGECYNWENSESEKEYICEAIERNIMRNQIRHNWITCAYGCVIMGMLLLIALFVLIFIY